MNVPNGFLVVAAVVIAAAVGAETYLREEISDLRRTVADVATKADAAATAATAADTAAKQAAAKADQADASAQQAKAAADQAQAVATAAKAATDRQVSAVPAQTASPAGPATDIATGRDLALQICSACHVVAADQHFAPTLRPPAIDFRAVANRPTTTAATLRAFLSAPHGKMPDAMLVNDQITALADYLMSLRTQP